LKDQRERLYQMLEATRITCN